MNGTWVIETSILTKVCPNCTYEVHETTLMPDTFKCPRCDYSFRVDAARLTYWSEMESGWIEIPKGCLLVAEEIAI